MKKAVDKPEVEIETKAAPVSAKFRYVCPACTNTAVETSNKMLGVDVTCLACGATVKLNQPENYIAL